MAEYYSRVKLLGKCSPSVIKKFDDIFNEFAPRTDYTLKFMLYKGLRYIPAIGYSSYEYRRDYTDQTLDWCLSVTPEYNKLLVDTIAELMEKVEVRTFKTRRLRWEKGERFLGEYYAIAVAWSSEILDVEGVKDEAEILLSKKLLFKEEPKDRRIVEEFLTREVQRRFSGDLRKDLEKWIDNYTDGRFGINENAKDWGKFFKIFYEFHKEHPEAKFLIYCAYS